MMAELNTAHCRQECPDAGGPSPARCRQDCPDAGGPSPACCRQDCPDAGGPSPTDCCWEKDTNVPPGSAGIPAWTGPPPDVSVLGTATHPPQHTIQPEMLDTFSFRFHCPHQSTQCHLSYPNYLQEPQLIQYHLLTGPVPGSLDSSHHSSVSASWFISDPIRCSMMPGEVHSPIAVDHQQFEEVLTEVTSHITQPVQYGVSGGEQVVLVNPNEPGPVFLTMESASSHIDDGLTRRTDVSVLEAASQYHRTARPLYQSKGQTTNIEPGAPERTDGALCATKWRKPCHCTRSKCLKLYCECFASGVMCSSCDCSDCHNNADHAVKRHKAIKSCLGRNPDAFRPKIAGGNSGEVKGWHNKGCNCKRSGCLKNYCGCYEANIMCTSSCNCVGCRNYDNSSQVGLKEKTVNVQDRCPASVITPAVVEAVCGCLLARAEEAEKEAQSPAQGEHKVLQEFGQCLSQIIKAMFK